MFKDVIAILGDMHPEMELSISEDLNTLSLKTDKIEGTISSPKKSLLQIDIEYITEEPENPGVSCYFRGKNPRELANYVSILLRD